MEIIISFSPGILVHPWEETITIYGEKLISFFVKRTTVDALQSGSMRIINRPMHIELAGHDSLTSVLLIYFLVGLINRR